MDFEIFEKMDAPELRKYIQFLLKKCTGPSLPASPWK
jgi:hypothetical protein